MEDEAVVVINAVVASGCVVVGVAVDCNVAELVVVCCR